MKIEELNIDIYQYVQWDDEDENIIYFNSTRFLNDAREYIENENVEYDIVEENADA